MTVFDILYFLLEWNGEKKINANMGTIFFKDILYLTKHKIAQTAIYLNIICSNLTGHIEPFYYMDTMVTAPPL